MAELKPEVPKPATSLHSEEEEEHDAPDQKDTYLHGWKLALVFFGLAMALFVIILDQTILIPAIPVIASDFNSVNQIGWISSSYFVTQCATILIWGQVLAMFSQKNPLLMAIFVFEVGSLIAAVSQNFVTLIVGRAVAGIGGSAIIVATISISSVVIELKRRPIFFGLFGVIFVLGSVLGPLIGGLLTSESTWRWCFYINLPIGGLSIATVFFCIPTLEPPPPPTRATPWIVKRLRTSFGDHPRFAEDRAISRIVSLDWIATIIVLGAVVSLTLALIDGGSNGWHTATVIAGFTCAGVGAVLLLLWEILVMKQDGMVPLRVGKFRSVWGSAGLAFCRMISAMATLSYLPTFMQATRHQSAIHSAISSFPYAIGMAVFALLGAVVVQKSGRYKWALCLGSVISAVGGGLLYTIGPDTAYSRIAGFQIIGCAGVGLIMMNAMLAAQAEMDANGLAADIPQATAVVSLFQLLGGSLGGSIGGTLLTNGLRRYLPTDIPEATRIALTQTVNAIWTLSPSTQKAAIDAYAHALDDVFVLGAAASALGLFFALMVRDINIKGKKFDH